LIDAFGSRGFAASRANLTSMDSIAGTASPSWFGFDAAALRTRAVLDGDLTP
jgi:hypothetical protein